MLQSKPGFDGAKGDILEELYEWPDVTFSSHTLTQRLNPALQITGPDYRTAFVHVSGAIEEHIGRGLIRGKRSRNDDGIFFNNLKLTPKGEQAAIQVRDQRALPDKIKQIMDVADLIRERDRGAKD